MKLGKRKRRREIKFSYQTIKDSHVLYKFLKKKLYKEKVNRKRFLSKNLEYKQK